MRGLAVPQHLCQQVEIDRNARRRIRGAARMSGQGERCLLHYLTHWTFRGVNRLSGESLM
jgi:hypothetical protein